MKVYLDSAASSQLDPQVLEAMLPFYQNICANPSSTHSFGRSAKAAIENARKQIAKSLNASPLEIIFTSCGTESNNMALKCAVAQFDVQHIITTKIEHKCVLNTCLDLAKNDKVLLHYVAVDSLGYIDMTQLEEMLTSLEGKKLVTLMHANNEIGTFLDIECVGNLCKATDSLFHTDTVQTVGHYNIDLNALNIHFMSGSAHKFHGPSGIGFLYMRKDAKISPLLHGGGQERSYRSGTENVAGIVGMAKALELYLENLESYKEQILTLKNYMRSKLQENIEDVQFNGDLENSLYTVLNVSLPPAYNKDMLLFSLDMAGVACSGGSACSSGASKQSHVMQGINHSEDRKSIRFSFSHNSTKEEIDYAVAQLVKIGEKKALEV